MLAMTAGQPRATTTHGKVFNGMTWTNMRAVRPTLLPGSRLVTSENVPVNRKSLRRLHYLARYTHRVAISNHRLVAVTDDAVSFRWKDYRHGSQMRTLTLDVDEFLRRLSSARPAETLCPHPLLRFPRPALSDTRARPVSSGARGRLDAAERTARSFHHHGRRGRALAAGYRCASSNGRPRGSSFSKHSSPTSSMTPRKPRPRPAIRAPSRSNARAPEVSSSRRHRPSCARLRRGASCTVLITHRSAPHAPTTEVPTIQRT